MNSKKVAIAAGSSVGVTALVGLATYLFFNNIQGDINGSSSPNPCVDFYEFACGKWMKENPLSTESDSKTTFTQAQLNIDKFFWKLVTNGLHYKDDPHLQEAKKFYKSCTNSRSPDTFISTLSFWISTYFSQWDPLPSTLNNDGAPNIEYMDLTDFCLPAISHLGSSPLFSLTMDPQTRSIKISQGSLSVDLTTDEAQSKKNKDEFHNIAFTLEILELHEAEVRAAYQMMTYLSKIRWSYLFENVFKEAEYEDYEGLPITIEGEGQLKQRCKQHASALETDRKRFQTMMIINFLNESLKYAIPPTTDGTTDPSASHSQPRFDVQCFNELKVVFAYTLEKYYIPSHVNETYKKEVTTIFDEVKQTVLKSIRGYNWLNEDQKIILSNKIEKMEIHALYTSVRDSARKEDISMIYRFPMKEDDYYGNVFKFVKSQFLDVMRSILFDFDVSLSPLMKITPIPNYQRQKNRVYVNPGFIQPPFYIDGGDMASQYGRRGFFIGHELFHAIDITGVWFDENGDRQNFELFWALSNAILAKTDCFQEQYGRDETAKHKISAQIFLDEIIADNGALDVSFKTYEQLSAKLAGHVSQDPDTTRKHDQSFFRDFAQILCGHHSGKALEEYINTFPYPSERERVNVPLSNSEEFAKAYDCPIGSPMNPSQKCRIY
ncbi:Neprilysin-2 [Schistosoma japonicum]|nr:Neprilysin-2 [Schistosoma japonicum]